MSSLVIFIFIVLTGALADACSPYAYIDPLHANLNTLFVELFKDALNEYAYAAEIAGLGYNLSCSLYGISVRTSWPDFLSSSQNRQEVILLIVLVTLFIWKRQNCLQFFFPGRYAFDKATNGQTDNLYNKEMVNICELI